MKVLLSLFGFILASSVLAQGQISPEQQNRIIQESHDRVPASAENINPVEAKMVMEKLQKGQRMKEEQNQFLEELDKEE